MELTKEELKVLKFINKEPGNLHQIIRLSKVEEKNLKKILRKLEDNGLIYYQRGTKIFSTTFKGNQLTK